MLEIKPYADKDAYAMYVRMVIQVDTHNVQLEALLDVLHGLGEHIIESDGATDYRYLPLVLISGDFMIKDGILCATDYDVIKNDINAYLPNYIGDYSVFADIKVPKDGKIFIQTDFGLYTKVFIEGKEIGSIAFEPQIIEIPQEFYGNTVQTEFKVFTPVTRMFGDVTRYNATQPLNWWANVPHIIYPGRFSSLKTDNINLIVR